MTTTNTRLTAALAYGEWGLRVFPCHSIRGFACSCPQRDRCESPGKHPRITGWRHNASADRDQLTAWWQQWPDANIGLDCEGSRILVVDIDPRNGGAESWADLRGVLGAKVEETWTSLTGGGGTHYFYRAPDGFDTSRDALAAGIDIKWRGFVVLPPSEHISGGLYTWEIGSEPSSTDPAELPALLSERLQPQMPRDDGEQVRTPLVELLSTECPEGGGLRGGRHKALISILGYLVNRGLSRDEAEAMAQMWNARYCRPPLSDAYIVREVEDAYTRWSQPAIALLGQQGALQAAEESESSHRYEIIDGPDYLDQPPPTWLVEGMIAERSFFAILGQPGSYKTFYALDLGLCVATETPFFNRAVRRGAVLYILGEGASGFSLRMRAWQQHRQVRVPREFKVLRGLVPLIDQASVMALVQQVLAYGIHFQLVIVDTLSRSMAGADENSSKDMTAAVAAADLIGRLLECTVGVLHHGTKADGSIRGHSSLPGALDTILKCSAEQERGIVAVTAEKQKDAEPFPVQLYKREVVELAGEQLDQATGEIVVVAGAHSSVVLEPLDARERQEAHTERLAARLTPYQREAAQVLVDRFGANGATHDAWWKATGWPTAKRQTFKNAQTALAKLNLLSVVELGGESLFHPHATLAGILER